MSFMATRGKRRVDAFEILTDDMELEVIAHSLSQINRFTGHLDVPYSVGQHSVWVSEKIESMGGDLNMQRMGLMHDGSESFLSDIPSPYKKLLPDYRRLENKFQNVIYKAFGIATDVDLHLLHYCDMLAGLTEARDLHPFDFSELPWVIEEKWNALVAAQRTILPLSWSQVKDLFIHRAKHLKLAHIQET